MQTGLDPVEDPQCQRRGKVFLQCLEYTFALTEQDVADLHLVAFLGIANGIDDDFFLVTFVVQFFQQAMLFEGTKR